MIIEHEKLRTDSLAGTSYKITFSREERKAYNPVIITNEDVTNCKLSYIHGIGKLRDYTDEEKSEVLDSVLKISKGYCIINTINKEVYNFIKDNYQTYYHHAVPVGYGNDFQYNICIRNHVNPNYYCKVPKQIDSNMIEQKLRQILKSKRRKADYVDEFINAIK